MTVLWLAGSSGTGKSTTAKILGDRLNMPVVDNISRSSPHKMGTIEHQQYISKAVFKLNQQDNIISTRSPFDVLSYTVAFKVPNLAMDSLHSFIFASGNPTVIYFPFGFPAKIEDDSFRPTSPVLNEQVDSEIKKQLNYYKVEYYEVKKESANARANSIIQYLGDNNG